MDANMQLTINSFRPLFPDNIFFPDISLTSSKIPDISLTAVKLPDNSRFSTQVVTLKLEWCGYPMVNKMWRYFSCFSSIPACDGQTDRHLETAQSALCIASHGKNDKCINMICQNSDAVIVCNYKWKISVKLNIKLRRTLHAMLQPTLGAFKRQWLISYVKFVNKELVSA